MFKIGPEMSILIRISTIFYIYDNDITERKAGLNLTQFNSTKNAFCVLTLKLRDTKISRIKSLLEECSVHWGSKETVFI